MRFSPKVVVNGRHEVHCIRCDRMVPIEGTHQCLGNVAEMRRTSSTPGQVAKAGIQTVDGQEPLDLGGK